MEINQKKRNAVTNFGLALTAHFFVSGGASKFVYIGGSP